MNVSTNRFLVMYTFMSVSSVGDPGLSKCGGRGYINIYNCFERIINALLNNHLMKWNKRLSSLSSILAASTY